MNELALFAGAGGGILGGHLLGWRTICAVERDAYAAGVLAQRQNDGCLSPFPIWADVTTFDGKPWRGRVDVISGGFPCQDISSAGRGEGITGARSGLWSEFARIIGEVRPRYVLVENSPILTSRGLGVVLGDLASMGYDAEWGVLGAADVGAPHQRDRIWIVAHSVSDRGRADAGSRSRAENESKELQQKDGQPLPGYAAKICRNVADAQELFSNGGNTNGQRAKIPESGNRNDKEGFGDRWWPTEPAVGRVVNGLAYRVDRLKAIGNGQVPAVAARAFTECLRRILR